MSQPETLDHKALSPSRTPTLGPRDLGMKPRPSPWHDKRLFDGSFLQATLHPRQASSTIRPLQGPICLCIVLPIYEDLSPSVLQEDAQRTKLQAGMGTQAKTQCGGVSSCPHPPVALR